MSLRRRLISEPPSSLTEAYPPHRSPLAQNNIVTLSLPTGRHLVRLKAPGYHPAEFIPADRAENRLGHHDFLTVELMEGI